MHALTVVDEIFLRTHRGMGTPIALQGLWRTPDAMEPALLRAIHRRLRLGRLGRRVVNPRVPGARRTWQPNINAHPLDLLPNRATAPETDWPTSPPADDRGLGPLPDGAVLAWADALGADLDPEFGPGWRLSAARLEEGGTIVALTCSHALADARGLIHAVTVALGSLEHTDATSTIEAAGSAPVGERHSRAPSSEWSDAVSQWATIIGGTARALNQTFSRPLTRRTGDAPSDITREPGPVSAAAPPLSRAQHSPRAATSRSEQAATQIPGVSTDRHPRPLLRTFDAAHWDTTAIALGASANTLFIHLVANILWHNGFPSPTITASLPVDTRDEPRVDNDLAMTAIAIQRADSPATIRDKARAAYQRRMSSPAGLPEEILQVVPDRLAYTLSKGAGERDILCSNIGALPDSVRRIGPHDCTRVAARAIHPGITTFPRTQLAGYLSRLDTTYTLALVGLAADNDFLAEAVDKACAAAGLRPHPW